MGNWINFRGIYRGEPLVSVDPFEALEIKAAPTILLHIRESSIQGVMKFKLLSPDAKVPMRKYSLDAGLDVYALETTYIAARSQAVMRTGIALAGTPDNCVIQIWSKSGLDARLGLHVGAGIVDPGYRGEILVLLKNMSDYPIGINKGDAIAQLVIVPCLRPIIEVTEHVEITDRNAEGGIAETLEVEYER